MQNSNSWYNKTVVVILLLIFIFPIGLYALWKNEKATKSLKIIVSVFFAIGIIFSMNTEPIPEKFDLQLEKENELRSIYFYAEKNIIKNLKDPESFELVDSDYKFLSDTIYEINITYSATNSFGGRIQSKYLQMGILKFNEKDTSFTRKVTFENY